MIPVAHKAKTSTGKSYFIKVSPSWQKKQQREDTIHRLGENDLQSVYCIGGYYLDHTKPQTTQ